MKQRILIVDDEESIRLTYSIFLTDEGFEVDTASNYDSAIEKIDQKEFDMAFVDIILGEKTGLDVINYIKQKDNLCPVVIITGMPTIETAAEAIRAGAYDYIPKPLRQESIIRIAKMAVEHKQILKDKERYRLNLDAIFKGMKDGIISIDTNMTITEINDAAINICSLSKDVIGKTLTSISDKCNQACSNLLIETIKSLKPLEASHIECKKNEKIINIRTSPIINNGKLSGAILILRDETDMFKLKERLAELQPFPSIIGKSRQMQGIYSTIKLLSDINTTVLITGESGTGKELIAEAIHYSGIRKDKPFVKVNCSALPETLLESELFGHVKGAFTGAIKDRMGRFHMAHGGTLFLDEIGDISQIVQLKLLRVLQEREFERLGDSISIKVDTRIIAATNQDLQQKVLKGEFREDLYYRLKVVEIKLPPLRERREDIPSLVTYFVEKFNDKFKKQIKGISDDVMTIFMNYQWPGNIRQMEHVIEHAFVVCSDSLIQTRHLPDEITAIKQTQATNKRILIEEALQKTAGNKTKAAKLLGISRRTIYRKLKK